MQILLLEKIHNLGELGEEVNVKPGYARNFLIPKKKAVPATKAFRAEFETRRAELEEQQAEVLMAAQKRAAELEGKVVTIKAKAGEEGKLFGSIGPVDVADAVTAAGIDVQRGEVRLPEATLRQVGEYEIGFQFHPDVTGHIKLQIEAQG